MQPFKFTTHLLAFFLAATVSHAQRAKLIIPSGHTNPVIAMALDLEEMCKAAAAIPPR